MERTVIVEPYDPRWIKDFEVIRAEIAPALGTLATSIEHVGGTSVPGLSSEPIIDIDVVVKDESDLQTAIYVLKELGYRHLGNDEVLGRDVFAYEGIMDLPEHHLFVCDSDSDELKRHLALRDYLRSHPEEVREFCRIKEEGALRYPNDKVSYAEAKIEFMLRAYESIAGQNTPDKNPYDRVDFSPEDFIRYNRSLLVRLTAGIITSTFCAILFIFILAPDLMDRPTVTLLSGIGAAISVICILSSMVIRKRIDHYADIIPRSIIFAPGVITVGTSTFPASDIDFITATYPYQRMLDQRDKVYVRIYDRKGNKFEACYGTKIRGGATYVYRDYPKIYHWLRDWCMHNRVKFRDVYTEASYDGSIMNRLMWEGEDIDLSDHKKKDEDISGI